MNKILTNKLNKNIINMVGSYLLPIRTKFNIIFLKIHIVRIKESLEYNMVYPNDYSFIQEYYQDINKCKITYSKLYKFWTMRPKFS